MSRTHTDLSTVQISVAPSPATSGTSLGVSDANAALLPDIYPWWGLLRPHNAKPTRSNSEIVKVTAGSSSGGTTTYTIVRAQGIPVTTARSPEIGWDLSEVHTAQKQIETEKKDGWENPYQTWIRESNNSFSEPIDATLKYKKGDKLKYKQGGEWKFQYVLSVGAYSGGKTIITTTGGSDFVFTSGITITDNYYSHQENPIGFPELFNYVPSWTNLTIGSATVVFKFKIISNVLKFNMSVTFAANTTISGNVSFSIPVNYSNVSGMYSYLHKIGQGSYLDSETNIYEAIVKPTPGDFGKLNLNVLNTDTIYGYSITQVNATIPFTWTTNDRIDITADYFI